MPMHHPKKYPRSTSVKAWGCPRGTPSSLAKIRSPFNTLYFYCFMHYAFFLERQLFQFSVLFCFVFCNKWLDPNKFLLEKLPCFSFAKNTPFFTLIVSTSILFFQNCVQLSFFALIFVQILLYIFIKVYFCLWSLLVFIKRGVYKNFKWCWKREKALCKIVVQEGACVDCGLGFFMSCLMSF